MTWKPKESYSAVNKGACPVCGTPIEITQFLDDTLTVKGESDPVDVSEPNLTCVGCGTDLVVDLVLQFVVNSQVYKKEDLTAEAK